VFILKKESIVFCKQFSFTCAVAPAQQGSGKTSPWIFFLEIKKMEKKK
jgi:hypothetical protein